VQSSSGSPERTVDAVLAALHAHDSRVAP